jgi:acyl-phosphate glycerol 3-phosphate acyltransferase
MHALPALLLTLLASYLVGAVPFGYLVARARGVDILKQGSGNIGATNVGRVLGRRFGLLVFACDFAKGALPVLAARLAPAADLPADSLPAAAGVAAFLGHLFPVYLRFRGGKGVATAAGVVVVLVPPIALAALLCWVVVLACTRFVSLASLAAAAVLCGLRLATTPHPWEADHLVVTLFCLAGAGLIFLRHRANIGRLIRGNENRVKDTPAMLQLGKVLHLLALGLWFGTAVFFTITALVLFQTFEQISREPADQRPAWFPLPGPYAQDPPDKTFPDPHKTFPDPLRLEQGSRAAGAAVSPLFGWYYALQGVCGAVAAFTAVAWAYSFQGRGHRLRAVVLVAALASVGVGWWLERVVSEKRGPRNDLTDACLAQPQPSPADVQRAEAARADFGRWHGYSVMINLLTLGLVTVAMVLTASLPTREFSQQAQQTEPARSASDGNDVPSLALRAGHGPSES